MPILAPQVRRCLPFVLAGAVCAVPPAAAQMANEAERMRTEGPGEPAPRPPFLEIEPRVDVSVGYTDNVLLQREGREASDFFLDVGPGVVVRAVRPRFRTYTEYQLDYLNYLDTEGLNEVVHNLTHASTSRLYEDYLFLDTQSIITQQILDPSISLTAREDIAQNNAATVGTFAVSPYVLNRWGGTAESELRYRLGQVTPFDDEFSSTTSNIFSGILRSGDDFAYLHWTALAEQGFQTYSGDNRSATVSTTDLELDGAYDINRYVSVLASVGVAARDDITYGTDGSLDPQYSAGFTVRPGPRTHLSARYRRRLDHDYVEGDALWRITQQTQLSALHTQEVTTSQELMGNQLGRLAVDPITGDPIDVTRIPFVTDEFGNHLTGPTSLNSDLLIAPNAFAILDSAFNRRYSQIAVDSVRGRNTLQALIFREERWSDVFPLQQEAYGTSLRWQRQLTPLLTGIATARYRHVLYQHLNDREDDVYSAALALNYWLGETLMVFADYTYLLDERSLPAGFTPLGDVTENVFTVGLRKTF